MREPATQALGTEVEVSLSCALGSQTTAELPAVHVAILHR